MEELLLGDRAVEVLYNAGRDGTDDWRVGSGFIVRDAVVLTAAHVVGPVGQILIRRRGQEELPARIWSLAEDRLAFDEAVDLAVLEIVGDGTRRPRVDCARVRLDAELGPGGVPNVSDCWGIGFPHLQQKRREGREMPVRDSRRIDGYLPVGEGLAEGLATLRVTDAPMEIPPTQLGDSPWQGISGTLVFAGGMAVGVVSEHHPPAGTNALTVVPLGWLDRCQDAQAWWSVLGVDNAGELPVCRQDQSLGACSLRSRCPRASLNDLTRRWRCWRRCAVLPRKQRL